MLPRDSLLYQIPSFTTSIVEECQKQTVEDEDGHQSPVESVLDILDMEDDVRQSCLSSVLDQMNTIAEFCNGYGVVFFYLFTYCIFECFLFKTQHPDYTISDKSHLFRFYRKNPESENITCPSLNSEKK